MGSKKRVRKSDRREHRVRMLMGAFIAVLMVASGFGVYLSGRGSPSNGITEYGHYFSINQDFSIDQEQRYLTTKIDGVELIVYNLPSSVAAFGFPESFDESLAAAQMVVFTFDPASSPENLFYLDTVRFNFEQALELPVVHAVTEPSSMYALPQVTCANASVQFPIWSFEVSSGSPEVVQEGSCFVFRANTTGFIQLHDRLLYELYDVYE